MKSRSGKSEEKKKKKTKKDSYERPKKKRRRGEGGEGNGMKEGKSVYPLRNYYGIEMKLKGSIIFDDENDDFEFEF